MRNWKPFFLGIFSLFLVIGCGDAEPIDVESGDARDDSFLAAFDERADVPNTIHENSAEARAILRVVNRFSRHKLISEADVYWRSAANIIDYREGEDGKLGTDDDRVVFTLAELDEIPYVGKTAFRRLRAYVNNNDLVVYDDVVVTDDIPQQITTDDHTIVRGEIPARSKITIRLEGNLGDRVLMLLRKASDDRWNPRLAILDDEGHELVSVNPWGTADARIPQLNDEANRGWEVDREGTSYTLVLHNTNYVDGLFEFSMECVGGPCFASQYTQDRDTRPLTELFGDELRTRMVSDHQENHIRFSYYDARMEMFSSLDNVDGVVECVYTGAEVETATIPSNLEMNAEHTWPQSKGAFDGAARSDLHHIYPVTSMINSLRGAAPYCEVSNVLREMGGARLGDDERGVRCFEPRNSHKGNAARAMFYFAVVYQQEIDDVQEAILRRWHEEDPVDASERLRAGNIQVFQGSAQPFVANPELVDQIADF